MLTGDKLETATCIAKSSHLVSRNQDIHVFKPVRLLDCPSFPALRCDHDAPTINTKSLSSGVAVEQISSRGEAHLELNAFRRKHDCALVISGDSLEVLQHNTAHGDISLEMMQPNPPWEG